MTDKLNAENQKLEADAQIELFELDATTLGGGINRFCSSLSESGAVSFGGETYTAVDVEASGFESSGQGALATPTIRISNVNLVGTALINGMDDLIGAILKRIRTYRQFLDDGLDPDSSQIFPIDVYKVERKIAANKVFVEWELSAALDQFGEKLPARQILRDSCRWRYRAFIDGVFDYTAVECPYTGDDYFDVQGEPVVASEDHCGKRLSDCRLRFGQNEQLPTSAFPGVARIRAR